MTDRTLPTNEAVTRRLIFSLDTKQQVTLQMLISGRTNAEIAHHFNAELSTVKSDIQGIFKKLGVWNRLQLVNKVAPVWNGEVE